MTQKMSPRRIFKGIRYVLQQLTSVFSWIRKNPVRDTLILDLREIPEDVLRLHFSAYLRTLATDSEFNNRPIGLNVILSPAGLAYIPDLFTIFTFMPKWGTLEFFDSLDDCQKHHQRLMHNQFSTEYFPENKKPRYSIALFQKPGTIFRSDLPILSQSRSFLKTFGRERSIYFCDLSHLEGSVLPNQWQQFFLEIAKSAHDTLLLVLTPTTFTDKKYLHSNIVFIKELGLTLHDYICLAWTVDGFIGGFNVISAFALQRKIPTILLTNALPSARIEGLHILKEDCPGTEIWTHFLECRGERRPSNLQEYSERSPLD